MRTEGGWAGEAGARLGREACARGDAQAGGPGPAGARRDRRFQGGRERVLREAPAGLRRPMNLGIELPPAPEAAGSYRLAKRYRDVVYLSGHGPIKDGNLITGKVGTDLSAEEGVEAARITGLNIVA